MKTFEGKVAIVTGGSSGIGAACAIQLARERAKVVIAARDEDQCVSVLREIKAAGSDGFFVKTDVSRNDQVEAMVMATMDRFGRLDCAVNSAGILGPVKTPIAEIEKYRMLAAKYSAMNRLGQASETAAAVTWLCSDAASFVNGAVLTVDGGDTTRLY